MKLLKKINYVFDKKHKIKVFILMVLILIGSIMELIGVTAILPFINLLMDLENYIKKPYLKYFYDLFQFESSVSFIIFIAVVIILIYIIKNVYLIFLYDIQFKFTYNSQRRLSERIMRIYMYQPYLFHTKHNRSEFARNIFGDPQAFFHIILAMLQLVTESSICIVLACFLFITDPSITIGIAILFFMYMLVYFKGFKKKMIQYGGRSREQNAELTKCMYQSFGGIKEIKIGNSEENFINEFNSVYHNYATNLRRNNLLAILNKPLLEIVCIGGLLIAVSIKIYNGIDMKYFIPVLTAFAVAAFRMLPSFNKIIGNIGTIIFQGPAADAIYTELHRVNEMEKMKSDDCDKGKEFVFEHEITVEGLSFQYPETEKNVIDNISLQIPKNKSVALIGPSGAGKTTLADIILGVLTPQSGSIKVDGVNVLENRYYWHKKIGYIPQTIFLTDDSIRRNVAFGYPHKEIDDTLVWNALEAAQIKTFVEGLPNGLETVIGENGVRLSGGQRQRIGIARALYKNPEVLMLDEATSALDTDTERAVMDAIESLAGKKTLIIIAHRLKTIENCDYKYEVNEGKVMLVK